MENGGYTSVFGSHLFSWNFQEIGRDIWLLQRYSVVYDAFQSSLAAVVRTELWAGNYATR